MHNSPRLPPRRPGRRHCRKLGGHLIVSKLATTIPLRFGHPLRLAEHPRPFFNRPANVHSSRASQCPSTCNCTHRAETVCDHDHVDRIDTSNLSLEICCVSRSTHCMCPCIRHQQQLHAAATMMSLPRGDLAHQRPRCTDTTASCQEHHRISARTELADS